MDGSARGGFSIVPLFFSSLFFVRGAYGWIEIQRAVYDDDGSSLSYRGDGEWNTRIYLRCWLRRVL